MSKSSLQAFTRRRALQTAGAAALGGVIAGVGPAARAASQIAKQPSGPLGFNNGPAAGMDEVPLKRLYGKAPAGLNGVLYRNGPGHFTRGGTALGHWFDGDGLIRAFRINEDGARLSARFVDTPKRRRDERAGAFVTTGFGTAGDPDAGLRHADDANAANTSLLMVQDRLWALWEAGSPFVVDPDNLETEGAKTLRADLAHMPFSAHPKIEPDGRIWNFGLSFGETRAFLWRLSPNGAVEATALLNLPRAAYVHDWAMTRTKLILPLAPWIAEGDLPPYVARLRWRPEKGMKALVIDKDDFGNRRIYDLPAGFLFHTGGASEDPDGVIRFDACVADAPTLDAVDGARIVRGESMVRPEPVAATITLRPNGDASLVKTPFTAEFPQTAGGGRDRLFAATQGASAPQSSYRFNALMAIDWRRDDRAVFDCGSDILIEEHLFVSDPARRIGGWLVGTGVNLKEAATELYVFDSEQLEDGPLAAWRAPLPLPLGFHGVWRA